jgi:acetoin utilization deacetylase AcuC-like enzyme
MKVITDERCTAYAARGHPERPARISNSLALLRSQTDLEVTWADPIAPGDEAILRAHTEEHVFHVKDALADFDDDTPAHDGIYEHARRSVGGAILAMRAARAGESVFSLLRPPGHHATRNRVMGFCYLNNMAVAALAAVAEGVPQVAVFDFDVHHGNGTEAILLNQPGTSFYSVHQYPCYPGTGSAHVGSNCFNYPVLPDTPREDYRAVIQRALEELAGKRPALVGVSAGFDAFAKDPLAQGTLEVEDFYWVGRRLRELGLPTFSLLEGGYSRELPQLILAYLKGIEGR